MPIKHFDSKNLPFYLLFKRNTELPSLTFPSSSHSDYLTERKHLQTLSLNVLADSRLGIDAHYYLQQPRKTRPHREPLLAATRRPPFLALTNAHRNRSPHPRKTSDAWSKDEAGQEEVASKLFEGRSGLQPWDLWRMRNVEFLVAPYVGLGSAHLPPRHPKSYIHAIFGPTDTLLYPGRRQVDYLPSILTAAAPTFTFTSKRSILNDLGVTEDQFLDIVVHEQGFRATRRTWLCQRVSAYTEYPNIKPAQYPDQYARTRSMIKYLPILSSEGAVVPLPLASTNNSAMRSTFTSHAELIGPPGLVWLTTGQIVEPPPLDNGERTEYKRFVKEVIPDGHNGSTSHRPALISSVSHTFWANRKVLENFCSHSTVQLAERVSGWNVGYTSSTIDFALCLGATATEKLAARTKGKALSSGQLDKKDELVSNVIWRFLELRGFLLNSHLHSPLARAMYTAIKHARLNDKFQEPLYLFLELVRAGVMHGHLWSGRAFSGGPSFGTDDEKSCMLLVMRVLSIVPLNFQPQPWSAPLSRELLVFNSFVRSLTRALRTLLEMTTLNMLLRQEARRARDDLLDIAISLPFQNEVNTGFGVLAKVFGRSDTFEQPEGVQDPMAEGVQEYKQMALDICEDTFPGVKSPKSEVERGFRFWDVALIAMRQLHSEGAVLRELIDQFEAAEAWLAPMRP
ncbi:XPG I-region protein [Pisolithus marmoratus]|nr:XPG I-region protein [Pisolithus marmoratus]